MRSIAIGILGVLFAGSIVGTAQQPAPPTFRAGTTLVDFTVVAVDARGNPVTDLRRDEISIVENESPRDVAFFQFEGGSPVAASPLRRDMPEPLPPGTFSNRPEHAPSAPRHLVAIVLDLINTSIAGQVQLQTELAHYLKQVSSIEIPATATLPATVPVTSEFTLNPQTTAVRVIVRDKLTGRYGSVDVPLSQLAAP